MSNSLIVLAVPDEAALLTLADSARTQSIGATVFREPDLADQVTALALGPSPRTRPLCANLPLAGRPTSRTMQDSLRHREARIRALCARMEDCEQTPGQSVLAHGTSVREHYRALVEHLNADIDLNQFTNWRLPAWVDRYRSQLAAQCLPPRVMDAYLTMHDCGKPDVLSVDDEGRRHFPGHSAASERTYREVFSHDPDVVQVAELIAHDMDIHLLKAVGVEEFSAGPHAVAHLLAGLAEVTSNAAMFGGVESTSYKIKFKALTSRGNAICARLFGDVTG